MADPLAAAPPAPDLTALAMPQLPPNPTVDQPSTTVSGRQTVFGLNYDGSPDTGDAPQSGFFMNPHTGKQYDSHDANQAFASLPFSVYRAAIGDPYDKSLQKIVSNGGFHVKVTAGGQTRDLPIGDLGPAAWTGNALDLSGGAARQMGLKDNGQASYQIIGPDNKPVQFKGNLSDVDQKAPVQSGVTRSFYSQQTLQKYASFPGAPGVKVALPEDVNRIDSYIKNGGKLYELPYNTQLSYHLAHDPSFLTKPENFPFFKESVWKPAQQKDWGSQVVQGLQNAPAALAKTAGDVFNWAKDTATMNQGNWGLTAATNAQGLGKTGEESVNAVDGLVTNIRNLPRTLRTGLSGNPAAWQQVDDQNARDAQALMARNQSRADWAKGVQNFAADAYNKIGMNGEAVRNAQPNQSDVEGLAQVGQLAATAGIPFGAGAESVGAFKPLFFERAITQRALEETADMTAAGLKSSFAGIPGAAPFVSHVQGIAAQEAKDSNAIWNALSATAHEPGTVSNLLQSAGPEVTNAGDMAKDAMHMPEQLIQSLAGGNVAGGAVGGAIAEKIGEHIPGFVPAVAGLKLAGRFMPDAGKLMSLAGKELSYGETTLPYFQRLAQQTKGLTGGVFSALDRMNISPAVSMTKGAVSGAVAGGLLNGMSSPMPNAGAIASGAAAGGILGMAGGGFGQWMKYQSPGQFMLEAAGDLRRFKSMLGTSDLQGFNRLSPQEQGMLSQWGQHHPGMEYNFIHAPAAESGWHDPAGGINGAPRITINTASATPLRGVIAHELAHATVHSGNYPQVLESMLGNDSTGKPGQYTKVDTAGKPILDAAGNMQTSQEFQALKQQYLNKLGKNQGAVPHLSDKSIALEIYAEHGVDYAMSGKGIVDAKSSFNPSISANPAAMRQAMGKLGYAFTPDGQVVRGTGLFGNLQRNSTADALLHSYAVERHKESLQHVDDAVNTVISPEALKQNPALLEKLKAVPEIARAADGRPILDKNGNLVVNSPKVVEQTAKSLGNLIREKLSFLPDAEKLKIGHYEDGGFQFMRHLPDSIVQDLKGRNEYNQEQIKNLEALNTALQNPAKAGQEFRMFYQAASHRGSPGSIAGAQRNLVPYGWKVSSKGNLLLNTVDFGKLVNNYLKLQNKPGMKAARFSGPGEFAQTADQVFQNHSNGMPGAAGLAADPVAAVAKRDAVNMALGLDTASWRDHNPLAAQVPKRTGSFLITPRIDRINNLAPTGIIRPFTSAGQYGMMNRNYLPKMNLEDIRSHLKSTGVDTDMYEKNGKIVLSRIVVPKDARGQGVGSSAMQQIVQYADKTGQQVGLSPSTDFGGSSKSRLEGFYRKFGFVPNKGRNKDFTSSESMIRNPSPSSQHSSPSRLQQ